MPEKRLYFSRHTQVLCLRRLCGCGVSLKRLTHRASDPTNLQMEKTMATGSLLALLDDIASVLDVVALMSKTGIKGSASTFDDVTVLGKTAMKKTSGVLGDDLALNAQQVSGVNADRELPVVWAVAKGSLLNKVILVPAALLICYVIPWLITPLLMLSGAFLCLELAEKVLHTFLHKDTEAAQTKRAPMHEKSKISGAIRTDFILSAEIVVIALGVVS